jgi:hypothetical protein
MKLGKDVLARFGLFAQKKEKGPDAFELRLQRTLTREKRHVLKRAVFRPLLQPVEA